MRPFFNLIVVCVSFLMVSFMISSCNNTTKWAEYTSKEGSFSVFMPADVKKTDKKYGKQVIHFVTWKPSSFALDKFKLFEVSYTDVPGAVGADTARLNILLDTSISNRKKDFTDLDVDAQPIVLNGYPGRAFIFQQSRGSTVTIVKECIVGNKRYDLTVISKKDYPTNIEMNKFFNSFHVLR